MSKQKYPRLGGSRSFKPKVNHKCEVCGDRASHSVTVEWWWMRGDDESYRVCLSHLQKLKAGDFEPLKAVPR